jgi:hypothetical protein
LNGVCRQHALTLLVPVVEGQEQQLDNWLREHKRALQRALERSHTTHFARLVLLPRAHDSNAQQLLALESNFDGELDAHVADLSDALGPLLDGALKHVQGYPGRAERKRLVDFVRHHSTRSAAFYAAHPGLSVATVRGDAALVRALDSYLRQLSIGARVKLSDAPELARLLRERARVFSREHGVRLGSLDRGFTARAPTIEDALRQRPLALLCAFALAPFFELKDWWQREPVASLSTPERRRSRDLIGIEEDRVDQNGLTHLVPIKPGWYRLFALKLMLWLVSLLAQAASRTGRLANIDSIHFARWLVLPDRRLLFFSNYDGSWEAYLGDFVDRGARGLTMIWSNTQGFPPARLLLFAGAKNEQHFKAWTRAYQVPTQVWYSAYPTLSVADVLRHARIRELLGGEVDATRARELLALL